MKLSNGLFVTYSQINTITIIITTIQCDKYIYIYIYIWILVKVENFWRILQKKNHFDSLRVSNLTRKFSTIENIVVTNLFILIETDQTLRVFDLL